MQLMLRLRRSILSASTPAFASGRALSTAAASRPRWAMIVDAHEPSSSPAALRASLKFAEPPRPSHLVVPEQVINPRPRPGPSSDRMRLLSAHVRAASGDGLLFECSEGFATAHVVGVAPTGLMRQFTGMDTSFDVTRFVCNPITGELFRMPDIDGTKDTSWCQFAGILTQSDRPDGRPDRRLDAREVVAYAGRLWWVDVSWGAVTVDPFSDRPELRFVELPRGSVTEPFVPVMDGKGLGFIRNLDRYRRIGVSEGRLRYVEVSQKKPFVLSSFVLEEDSGCWTLVHRVALGRLAGLGMDGLHLEEDDTPRIGVIDPLSASTMYLTISGSCVSVDNGAG
uniref:DUF1618 domain-containing protein n=1 Tax=Leersia perrieri TaxID=77586 RepID=A0A0D9WED2_9ORYZ